MGFFSFSKPKAPSYTDKVWKAADFSLKGLMTDALKFLTQGGIPVVVAHFKAEQDRMLSFLTTHQVPYFLVEGGTSGEALQQSKTIFVLEAKHFRTNEAVDFLTHLTVKSPVQLLFLGHYPLPSKENKFLEKLMPVKSLVITFYSSLDEPSFEIFGGERMTGLMEKLGMKDEEAIEHAMVTQSMKRAREKIEEKVKFEFEASSEKEWFQKNVKQV